MTHRLLLPLAAGLLSLAACAATGETEPAGNANATAPAEPAPSAPTCNAEAARIVVGQVASAEVVERARIAAGADTARTLAPNQAVTMEYLAGRLNLVVDAGNVVSDARCG